MTLIITGASGQLAGHVTQLLLERGLADRLVLVTRSPDKLEATARGAQVRRGDFDDPASLEAAFAGGDRMLLISASDVGRRVPQHRAAIEAAVAAGVSHVVYTSIVNPVPDNPTGVTAEHRETEQALRESGLDWTFLRNSLYAEFRADELATAAATGTHAHNQGHGRIAPVSREDCAAVAAAVLADSGHVAESYDVTGPELLDAEASAALYADLAGRPVEPVALDDDAFIAGLVAHGLPDAVAPLIASFGRAVREGYLEQQTDVVERLTGRSPRTLREVLTAAA